MRRLSTSQPFPLKPHAVDAPLRPRRRKLAIALVLVASLALLASLATYALLASSWGRARLRDQICRAISSQIRGSLEIDEIEEVALPRVRARGVRIVAPDGTPAIDVESANIRFDLSSFLSGNFVWRRADIRNGIVRVREDARGRVNMEETFAPRDPSQATRIEGVLDMRTMVTSNMQLEIGGGELPSLRLIDIDGIMRVHVDRDGITDIRFDDYRGHFVKGLPHGQLNFRDVKGHVQTGHKRLLRFEGGGEFEGEPVTYTLDIITEPKQHVRIEANFPNLSAASLSTLGVAVWSRVNGSSLEIKVKHGR